MATNGAPDNWEDADMDVSNKLSALNVNAATFVPNPNAAVFVPSWGPEAAAPKSENKDNGKMAVDEPSPVEAGPPPPADSWEDKADMSSSATTPEDEEVSMEDDTGEKNFRTAVRNFRVSLSSFHFIFAICEQHKLLLIY